MRSNVNINRRNGTIRCIGAFFQSISTCQIELIEGKSNKCGCADRATFVVRLRQMCQLIKIDRNRVSVDTPLHCYVTWLYPAL